MADKNFGVKKIELIGSSGTPNLTSPTNLNLNAVTVAVSTDFTIGGKVQSDVIVGTGYSVGIGSTQPSQALDVTGSIKVTDGINVTGIVTANSVLISNDGGNNGSVLIEDTGSYSQISFRASDGTTQSQIQGAEGSLYISSGSGGYISLSSPTANIFYPSGDVVLNNGSQGTTLIRNEIHVQSGITSFSNNVSVGGTISVSGGISTNGIGTAVSLNIVGNDLVITVGSLSTTLTLS